MRNIIPHREYEATITGADDINFILQVIAEIDADLDIVEQQIAPESRRVYRIEASGKADTTLLLDAFEETGAEYDQIQRSATLSTVNHN